MPSQQYQKAMYILQLESKLDVFLKLNLDLTRELGKTPYQRQSPEGPTLRDKGDTKKYLEDLDGYISALNEDISNVTIQNEKMLAQIEKDIQFNPHSFHAKKRKESEPVAVRTDYPNKSK